MVQPRTTARGRTVRWDALQSRQEAGSGSSPAGAIRCQGHNAAVCQTSDFSLQAGSFRASTEQISQRQLHAVLRQGSVGGSSDRAMQMHFHSQQCLAAFPGVELRWGWGNVDCHSRRVDSD
jgi:hypothetical protein